MGRRPERLDRLERLPASRRRRLRKGKEPAPRRGRVEVAVKEIVARRRINDTRDPGEGGSPSF